MKSLYCLPSVLILSFYSCFTFGQDVLTLSNAQLTIQSNGILTVQGGLNATAGSSMINNGTLYLKNNSVSNISNWTDNTASGVLSGTGLVNFNSSNAQNIYGKTAFYNLEINDGGLTLQNNDLTINNVLKLTLGKINTGSYAVYLANPNPVALTADGSNTLFVNSYINGKIKRGIASNTFPYYFPVGSTQPHPLLFSNNNVTGPTILTASFGTKNGTDAGLNVTEQGVPYTSVNNGGVWYLSADNAITSGSYDLRLYFNGFTGLTDNSFAILGRSEASSNGSDWSIPQNGTLNTVGGSGRMVSDGFALRKGITNIPGQFGIGMTSTVLPVSILYFNGKKTFSGNLLEWRTSLETNSSYFDVERFNGNQFEKIGAVAASGNSSVSSSYSYLDAAPLAGNNLYRLRMVDKNGAFVYSNIISLGFEKAFSITAMPNPVISSVTLKIISPGKTNAVIYLHDASGKKLKTWNKQIIAGVNLIPLDIQNAAAGNYSLKILFSNGYSQIIKLIKSNNQ